MVGIRKNKVKINDRNAWKSSPGNKELLKWSEFINEYNNDCADHFNLWGEWLLLCEVS